ncbi:SH3-binding, glutamic acid-rich protein-domain-containing protein [Dichotomocladium elegans]|nr:SH3-binding, glutamic acid-rich protein-domain-containing protein [Dichotomocladium elegans]
MVCLGPRKKSSKKPQLLSPDDAATTKTRSVKNKRSLIGRKSSTATATATATTAAGTDVDASTTNTPSTSAARASTRRSLTPRASLESTASGRKPTSRASSPRPRSPATRPQAPPPGTAPSVRSSARPTSTSSHSRNPSTASTVRKSPVAQLREDFDELKVKNNEHLQLIAQQEEELRKLKEQLSRQQKKEEEEEDKKDDDDDEKKPALQPSLSQLDFDNLQAQNQEAVDRLNAKQKELDEREKELKELKEQLPSIVVTNDQLEERERALEEKEKALEAQRKKLEAELSETKRMDEEAISQLEKLKAENEQAVERLTAKEQELEALKMQGGQDQASLNMIEELNKQLEAEKRAHEESLRQHEEMLAEKDQLLREQAAALEQMHLSHDEEIRKLKTGQTVNILALKQRHKQDMAKLQTRLQEAETKLKSSSNEELMEDEIERILREFEAAEHSHQAQIQSLEQSHQSELTDLKQNQAEQVLNLRKQQDQTQKKWTSRFLPTEAVSWPAPQPLSVLRKTNGPSTRTSASQRIAAAASDEYAPILIPSDTKKVHVYISTVSGNPVIKRKQEEMQQLLQSNDIKFELIDVAASDAALQHMKRANNNGSSQGRAKELPQLFVGGEYRGQFEDVSKGVEEGTLEELLRPAAERSPEEKAAIEKAEAAIMASKHNQDPAKAPPVRVLPAGPVSIPTLKKTHQPGPVRAYRGVEDDDEALFKELEEELQAGKLKLDDI